MDSNILFLAHEDIDDQETNVELMVILGEGHYGITKGHNCNGNIHGRERRVLRSTLCGG